MFRANTCSTKDMSADTNGARSGFFADLRSMPPLLWDELPPEEPCWPWAEELAVEAAAGAQAWAALERVLAAGEAALSALPAVPASRPVVPAEPGADDVAALRAARLAADVPLAAPGVARPVVASASEALMDELAGVLDRIGAAGPSGSRASVARLGRLAERTRGLFVAEVAEMDALGTHSVQGGAKSCTSSFVRDALHVSDAAAKATVRLATALRDRLPAVGAALRAGDLSLEHARGAVAGVRGLATDVVRDNERAVLDLALVADPVGLETELRNRMIAIDDRLAAEAERRARDRAGLTVSPVGDRYVSKGNHDAETGSIIRRALELAQERMRQAGDDRPKAARREEALRRWADRDLAEHADPDSASDLAGDIHASRTHLHLTATAEQLRDAAQPLLPHPDQDQFPGRLILSPCDRDRDGLSYGQALELALAGGHDLTPTFLDTGTAISRGALRRLVCDATISLVVLPDPLTSHPTDLADCHCGQDAAADGDLEHVACTCTAGTDLTTGLDLGLDELDLTLGLDHEAVRVPQGKKASLPPAPRWGAPRVNPLWVGRAARTITKQLWQALVWRDRTCVVKGCRQPAAGCVGHHVRHWLDGGLTDLENLVLLCHEHHHAHHDRLQDLPHRDGKRWMTQHGWRWFTEHGWAYTDPELEPPHDQPRP